MTKIFTMTHKKFTVPEDSVYVPLQVGKANHEDLGYLGDDTGDSISEWNCYYGELPRRRYIREDAVLLPPRPFG